MNSEVMGVPDQIGCFRPLSGLWLLSRMRWEATGHDERSDLYGMVLKGLPLGTALRRDSGWARVEQEDQ